METEIGKNKQNWWFISIWIIAILIFIVAVPFYIAPAIQEINSGRDRHSRVDSTLLSNVGVQKELKRLNAEIKRLDQRMDGFLPHTPYIIINTTKNRFELHDRNCDLIREGPCSSGSYTQLVSKKKTWVFKTPKGRMTILSKTENPVWAKPDWAFIEEGLPVPKPGDPSRFERGVLGDYALRMADGYLLHGTLYQRLLGMPVTHGCIRLGDQDLEVIYRTLPVGAYVYVY